MDDLWVWVVWVLIFGLLLDMAITDYRKTFGIRRGDKRPYWSYCENCGNDEFYDGPEGGGFVHYLCTKCETWTLGNGQNTKEVRWGEYIAKQQAKEEA